MPTLGEIADLLAVPLPAGVDAGLALTGVASLGDAGPDELSFVTSDAYAKHLGATRAAAVIVQRKVKLPPGLATPVLPVDDADLAMARVLERFAPPVPRPPAGVDPAARVAASATLADDAAIGPNVFIGERARIGRRSILHPGVYVGDDTVIGDDCQLFPNVVVRERITLGDRVTIHACTAIGTDGFGYRWDGARHAKVPQIGTVVIEDDVEIGSCSCVDRAKFGVTLIGRGTKIDNLVQIGHNSRLGPHCIAAGQAGTAGSVTLGARVMLGGQCAVSDHVTMADGSMLAGGSGLIDDVAPKGVMSGLPAIPHRQNLREQAALRKLPALMVQVRKLQEEVDRLKSGGVVGEPGTAS